MLYPDHFGTWVQLRTMLTANQGAVSTAMMANLDAFFFAVWAWLVSVQREIYGDIATMLRAFAATGDWSLLVAFVPWGVAFGAAHALTPGHSKMVLAMFVAGSGAGFASGLRTAGILASTHILMSVLIVLLGLPLASMALGEVGRAVFLETLSRSLLGLVGLWLLISALRSGNGDGHGHGRGVAFGVTAGLIPCPLTLLVMTFAVAHGVPEAGVAFAAMMLIGVGLGSRCGRRRRGADANRPRHDYGQALARPHVDFACGSRSDGDRSRRGRSTGPSREILNALSCPIEQLHQPKDLVQTAAWSRMTA